MMEISHKQIVCNQPRNIFPNLKFLSLKLQVGVEVKTSTESSRILQPSRGRNYSRDQDLKSVYPFHLL